MNKIKTEIVKYDFSDIQTLIDDIKKFEYVLIWKTDKVQFLYTSDIDNLDNFTEIRAFDKDGELHIVNNNGNVFGRIRKDGEGGSEAYFDEKQLLWGRAKSSEGNYTLYTESRGISLMLPIKINDCKGQRATLTIRSYLKKNNFEFYDFRIVEITGEKEIIADEQIY